MRTATLLVLVALLPWSGCSRTPADERPNLIILFADDLGYDDVSCYWTPNPGKTWAEIETPNIDALAAEGMRFTDFYVGSNSCTSSRAAILTGCYPTRVSMSHIGPDLAVIPRNSDEGINPDDVTIADVLHDAGYRTACIGKWHIGMREPFWPIHLGFDYYYGILPGHHRRPDRNHVIENDTVIGTMRSEELTRAYTEKAIAFIKENKGRPFFIYFAHHMPHYPLKVPEDFRGKSARGVYGDAVNYLDWSTGEIMKALRDAGIDDKTLVVFTSDNGPAIELGDHGGQCYPLRGGKGWLYEGGYRVPCIIRWPGKVRAGAVSHDIFTSLDLLPTFAALGGAELPDTPIDGVDFSARILERPGAAAPRNNFFYYHRGVLRALRQGKWKLHFKWTEPRVPAQLYDLSTDIGEQHNILHLHRQIAEEMAARVDSMRLSLGDAFFSERGTDQRPRARVDADGNVVPVYAPLEPPVDMGGGD